MIEEKWSYENGMWRMEQYWTPDYEYFYPNYWEYYKPDFVYSNPSKSCVCPYELPCGKKPCEMFGGKCPDTEKSKIAEDPRYGLNLCTTDGKKVK